MWFAMHCSYLVNFLSAAFRIDLGKPLLDETICTSRGEAPLLAATLNGSVTMIGVWAGNPQVKLNSEPAAASDLTVAVTFSPGPAFATPAPSAVRDGEMLSKIASTPENGVTPAPPNWTRCGAAGVHVIMSPGRSKVSSSSVGGRFLRCQRSGAEGEQTCDNHHSKEFPQHRVTSYMECETQRIACRINNLSCVDNTITGIFPR